MLCWGSPFDSEMGSWIFRTTVRSTTWATAVPKCTSSPNTEFAAYVKYLNCIRQILLIFVNPSKCRQVFPEEVLDLPAIEIYRTICSKQLTFRELKRPNKTWRPSKNTECFEISLKCSLPCSCLGVTATSFFSCVALRGKIEMVKSIWKFVVRVVTVGTLICAGFSVR